MEKDLIIDCLFYLGVFVIASILFGILITSLRWIKLYVLDFKRARKIYLRFTLSKSLEDFNNDEKYRLINEIKRSIK